ncbi:MAG: hemin uptake protein HemP [Reyranella sp.]|nr:hemin uptake protein HemP [Reyranella sp.]MDP3161563.1 hemin uptake protein HemP [Reyranella sp.]
MDQSLRPLQPNEVRAEGVEWDGPDLDIPVADSSALMSGKRELVIRHNGQAYRLRVTASDKLILTK